jgi:3,5-dihydroxyphenylacetyl-CoA synthase
MVANDISTTSRVTDTALNLSKKRACMSPRITAIGTGLSPNTYTQHELLDIFQIENPQMRSLFLNSMIERRHLTLPTCAPNGKRRIETQGELVRKHACVGLNMGRDSIMRCLEQANAALSDVSHICCVSSTGFITPGFSALLIKDLGLRRDCSRIDIVGMGCNAGLNGLSAVTSWASFNPGQLALLVCIEVCSAAYIFDGSMRAAVVNSLFGDGAAAISIVAGEREGKKSALEPTILRFKSYIIPEKIDAMRYDWNEEHGKFSFFLDPEIPYVIGANAESALLRLLDGTGIRPSDIKHWLVHSGGKKVIDSVRVNLRLTQHDVRHTIAVLRDYGNVSSASFLFSYERLMHENTVTIGDYGVMMTMGPGSTIEMALLHWN